jgi:D-proline reductase (dithiol) PrdB
MARLKDLPEKMAEHLSVLPCPSFSTTPWAIGPPLAQRRLAVVSTAGIHLPDDTRFEVGAADFRSIPRETSPADLVMSHVSPNFDRTGFASDPNVAYPLDRLREMVKARELGSLADENYSFMGATDPAAMETSARKAARVMRADGVNAVLLVPI